MHGVVFSKWTWGLEISTYVVLENYIIRQSKGDRRSGFAKLSVLRCVFGYYRYQSNQSIGLLWCQHFISPRTHNIVEFMLYDERRLLNQATWRDKSLFLFKIGQRLYTQKYFMPRKKMWNVSQCHKERNVCVSIYIWRV